MASKYPEDVSSSEESWHDAHAAEGDSSSEEEPDRSRDWLPKAPSIGGKGRGRGLIEVQRKFLQALTTQEEVATAVAPETTVREEPAPKKKSKTRCPVKDCPMRTRALRAHIFTEHLSPFFAETPAKSVMTNPEYVKLQARVLNQLRDWLVGDRKKFGELLRKMNQHISLPTNVRMLPEMKNTLRYLCQYMGWTPPAEFTITPRISSATCLLHWRVLAAALNWLSPAQREYLREVNLSSVTTPHPVGVGAICKPVSELMAVIPAGSEQLEEPTRFEVSGPEVTPIPPTEEATPTIPVEEATPITSIQEETPSRPAQETTPVTPDVGFTVVDANQNRAYITASTLLDLRRACVDEFHLAGDIIVTLSEGTVVSSTTMLQCLKPGTLLRVKQE